MGEHAIIDRLSGRSGGEIDPSGSLSVSERAAKFETVFKEFQNVKHHLASGSLSAHIGTKDDLEAAQKLLKASANYHAYSISPAELKQARVSEEITPGLTSQIGNFHDGTRRPRPTAETHSGPEPTSSRNPSDPTLNPGPDR